MFDPENRIVKICAKGLQKEEQGLRDEAIKLYDSAWQQASDDLEKFVAAHYVARLQTTPGEKLDWDLKCLHFVVSVRHDEKRTWLSSILYNVGRGFEATGHWKDAKSYYLLAKTYERFIVEDDAGKKLKIDLQRALERVS